MKSNDDLKSIQLLDLEVIDVHEEIANAYTVKIIESKIYRQLHLCWL